jgi:beta-lactamase class A
MHRGRRLVLQIVYEFRIALVELTAVDKGIITLQQKVYVYQSQRVLNLWDPLSVENPEGGSFIVTRSIQNVVSKSDNAACNELIQLLRTLRAVDYYFK